MYHITPFCTIKDLLLLMQHTTQRRVWIEY